MSRPGTQTFRHRDVDGHLRPSRYRGRPNGSERSTGAPFRSTRRTVASGEGAAGGIFRRRFVAIQATQEFRRGRAGSAQTDDHSGAEADRQGRPGRLGGGGREGSHEGGWKRSRNTNNNRATPSHSAVTSNRSAGSCASKASGHLRLGAEADRVAGTHNSLPACLLVPYVGGRSAPVPLPR